ncbi:hypothetical protein ACLMJK_004595 [Lecanora helva]
MRSTTLQQFPVHRRKSRKRVLYAQERTSLIGQATILVRRCPPAKWVHVELALYELAFNLYIATHIACARNLSSVVKDEDDTDPADSPTWEYLYRNGNEEERRQWEQGNGSNQDLDGEVDETLLGLYKSYLPKTFDRMYVDKAYQL